METPIENKTPSTLGTIKEEPIGNNAPGTQCAICLGDFKQPKILPCFHSFCLECLCDYVAEKLCNGTFPCPLCRIEIEVPDKGVRAFQSNFYVLARSVSRSCSQEITCEMCTDSKKGKFYCLDCFQYMCKTCGAHHQRMKITLSHRLMDLTSHKINKPIRRKKSCRLHEEEEIQFFCNKCVQLLCTKCKLTKHDHHVTSGLRESANETRNFLTNALETEKQNSKTSVLREQKTRIENRRRELLEICAAQEEKITQQANLLHAEIEKLCSDLVSEITNCFDGELRKLSIEDEKIDKDLQSHAILLETAQQMLDSADDIEVVRRGREMCKKIRNATNTISHTSIAKMPSVSFVDGDLTKLYDVFGKIRKGGYDNTPIILPPSKTKLSYNISGLCPKGDNCWISTWAKNICLLSDKGKVIKSVDIGVITNDLTAHYDGNIYISSNDKCIYKLKQTCEVKKINSLDFYPSGMCQLPDSDAMLLCIEEGVVKVTPSGKIFQPLLDSSKLMDPYRIAVNSNNYTCVTDRGQNKVFLYSPEGKLVATYSGHKFDNLAENYSFVPRGVCCNSSDNFVIADYSNKMITVLKSCGDVLEEFSTTDVSNGYPWSVDIDGQGRLWVGFSDGTICIYSEL